MLALDNRKKELLARIVQSYVAKAEPISSSELAEQFDLSPATIRNEMSELEEAGLIYQPHTSAGRIPAEAGFKLYIEEFLKEKSPGQKFRDELNRSCQDSDFSTAIKNVSRTLAEISTEVVIVGFSERDIYYTGLSNLFAKPEFSDKGLIINLSRLLDHLDEVIGALFRRNSQETEIVVGEDNPFGREFGTLIAKYQLGSSRGLLALLGPIRMSYDDNLGLINYTTELIKAKQKHD